MIALDIDIIQKIVTLANNMIGIITIISFIIIALILKKDRGLQLQLPGGYILNIYPPNIPKQTPSSTNIPSSTNEAIDIKVPFDDKKAFKEVVKYFNKDIEKNNNSVKQGKISFQASLYPLILINNIKSNYIIKAIAVVEKDEAFWPGYYGARILDVSNPKNERIFILSTENQLYELRKTLAEHTKRYSVWVTHTGRLTDQKRDFSIINDEVVAYYQETVDPYIDKQIFFEVNQDLLNRKREEFDNILKLAKKIPENIDSDDEILNNFKSEVFVKREMSLYINIEEYNQYEKDHPYYEEMQSKIIEEIKKEKRNFKLPCKILEIGPGTGILTEKYAGLDDIYVDLVELDHDCYQHLLKKIKPQYPSIKLLAHDDFCSYEFKNSYDLIISSFSNHHIPYSMTSKFYNKIGQLLNPNGKFIFGEEYIPDHLNSEDGRRGALLIYHIHIISEALKARKFQLAHLETISLNQGIDKQGEYKVSLSQAKKCLGNANFGLSAIKIGPQQFSEEWGVYFCIAKKN